MQKRVIDTEQRIQEYADNPASAAVYLQSNFKEFVSAFHFITTHSEFEFADFHNKLISFLEELVFGEPFNLLLNMPPRSGKSEIMVYFVCWTYAINPYCNNLVICYSDDLVSKFSVKMKSIIESELYKSLFGLSMSNTNDTKSFWQIEGGGETRAISINGAITGFGAGAKKKDYSGCIIIDDPIKPQDARSEVLRDRVINLYEETIKSRKNNVERTPIIVDMQRVHIKDLSGYIKKQIKDGNETNWKDLIIPALDESGKSFWENQYCAKYLLNKKKGSPYTFASQYQQEPIIDGGNVIKTDQFKRYTQLPPIVYTKIIVDTAMTIKKASDYTVFGLFGYDAQRNCYLIDLWRDKWESPELLKLAVNLWDKFRVGAFPFPPPRCLSIENRVNGITLSQELRRRRIPIQLLEPKLKDYQGNEYVADKVQRVEDVLLDIDAGYYWVPADSLNKPFMPDYISECQAFTKDDSHAHDDQVDITVYALKERQKIFNPSF
ncbi:MAG: phage terminase large subunit [Elusimicrobiota bacterium]|jgi:predicted phage terminase large subunit-like protein|nr:phage terminase large subunit [Elusimicrobiota bacterium]